MTRVSPCGAAVDVGGLGTLRFSGGVFRGGGGGADRVLAGALASGAIASGGGGAEARVTFAGGGGATLFTWPGEVSPAPSTPREPRTITRTPPISCSWPGSTGVDFSVAKSTQTTFPSPNVY